jgi:hypothetical protein
MTKVHVIQPIENYTSYGFGEAGKMFHSAPALGAEGVEFVFPAAKAYSAHTRYNLAFWDANCVGREVTGGPVSQKAHASLGAQAVMIASTPVTKPPVIRLEDGDFIVLAGLDTILKVNAGSRWSGPQVEIITTPEASVDYSELVAEKNAEPKRYVSEAWLSG